MEELRELDEFLHISGQEKAYIRFVWLLASLQNTDVERLSVQTDTFIFENLNEVLEILEKSDVFAEQLGDLNIVLNLVIWLTGDAMSSSMYSISPVAF